MPFPDSPEGQTHHANDGHPACALGIPKEKASTKAVGRALEDFVVERLRTSKIDVRARRTPGSGSGTKQKADIANDLNLAIECKNTQRLPSGAWQQTIRETIGDHTPVLIWHQPGLSMPDSMVMVPWYYFEKLLAKSIEPKTANPDRDFKAKLDRLRRSAAKVLQRLSRPFETKALYADKPFRYDVEMLKQAAGLAMKELD